MTAKEQAENLILKFKSSESQDGYNDVRDFHSATRCSLIAVDQILEIIDSNYDFIYWTEVKQELEKYDT
jgi:hypothetical protein